MPATSEHVDPVAHLLHREGENRKLRVEDAEGIRVLLGGWAHALIESANLG